MEKFNRLVNELLSFQNSEIKENDEQERINKKKQK